MIVFRVAKKPDSLPGMILYLILGRASDGVLIGHDWYHYRRGKFVKDEKETLMRKPGYYIKPICEAAPKDIQRLESHIGKPWRWIDSCFRLSPRLRP